METKKSARMNAEELVEIHALVRGRVQGVGFRYTTKDCAQRLGLVGTVRNLSDGSVEIYVKGHLNIIEELFRVLQDEHFLGKISEIISDRVQKPRIYQNFSILR